jgi:hypothetical protein
MGVGGLMGGRSGSEKKEELVEVGVAYVVPSFLGHAYVLADGESFAFDKATETVPGGAGLKKGLSLPKKGDTNRVRLVYLIPAGARNVVFQFFDYSYGHILIPIKGSLKLAAVSHGRRPVFSIAAGAGQEGG